MKSELKKEAIRLRVEERLSYAEIQRRLNCSKGSLSLWLRDYPLTDEELGRRKEMKDGRARSRPPYRIKSRGVESRFNLAVRGQSLSGDRKSKIAEAAALFRLALHGFIIFKPYFDGAKEDLLVYRNGGKIVKVQVRWARQQECGLPTISLRCSNGRGKSKRYLEDDFDVVVGYDLFSDTAYVFTHADIRAVKNIVTVRPEAAEAWDKLDKV